MVMLLVLATLGVEACMYVPLVWRVRIVPALVVATVLPGLIAAIVLLYPGWVAAGMVVVSGIRWLNMARIVRGRRAPDYLLRSARETGFVTLLLSGAGLALYVIHLPRPSLAAVLWIVAALQLAVGLVVLLSTHAALRRAQLPELRTYIPDRDLPTVSVAVPARNETQDLAECLESLLASEYPKLEILVLDDCSQDRTPDVIKSFAHDGVRFVQGEEPDSHWLAKNLAYQRLADEATGQYILFCGVDVRLGPKAIRALVNSLAQSDAAMASILPVRTQEAAGAAIVQPLRYWWELAVPRRYFGRPPVLSTCWIINRQTLQDMGGFESVSRTIIPEAVLARNVQQTGRYRFWRTGGDLHVATQKSVAEQRATAIRVRYPQLHKRMELAAGLAMLEGVGLLGALPVAVYAALTDQWALAALAGAAYSLLLATHLQITRATNPLHAAYAVFTFPLALVSELYLGLTSMLRYEFSHVEWKDRNISVPVMRVIPRLPPVPPADK